jgi:formyltetrahydrofolate-dependent phosphoribosylglycinamide formyltransferase
MFQKLKQRWQVNGLNLVLIICTFAIGGSLCGYAGRKLLGLTSLDKGVVWVILYILLITLLWPLAVLLISIPLGQFGFFRRYLAKVGRRFKGKKDDRRQMTDHEESTTGLKTPIPENSKPKTVNLAIFASGAGSNAQKIIEYFAGSDTVKVALVVCNKPGAGVLDIAAAVGIPVLVIEKERFFRGDAYLPQLKEKHIDMIILAGFLWKLPVTLIQAFPKKIINIHPALLPAYGGKGMYGHFVHEAVVANKEKESGISIHYVDEFYDHGEIIAQYKCIVDDTETPLSLAQKIHLLEHAHFPAAIAMLIEKQNRS